MRSAPLSMAFGAATLVAGRGGIARVARMSVRALRQAGIEPRLVSFLDGDGDLDLAPVEACSGSKLVFATQMHRAAMSSQFMLYDSIGLGRGHPAIPGLARPFATWMHGVEVWEALSPAYARVLKRANLVIANSNYTVARHEALHGPLQNRRICWLATEQDDPPTTSSSFSGEPTALILGRIESTESQKGHAELIDCWPRVVRAVPRARLILAGGGAGLEALRQRALASGATDSIDVLGFVPEHDLPRLFARSHVYAMPSRQEGFGIAYIEAMRHGLPVIASTHDAGQEVNADGITGYNVDLDHPGALEERMIALLSDPALARTMGRNGFDRWHEHFRFSCFAKRFLPIWQEFVTSKS